MAVLEINGDFSAEKSVSDERFDSVIGAISTIKTQIDVLKAAWHDDKSEVYISALENSVASIEPKLTAAKAAAAEVFDALHNVLSIYNNG